MQGGPLLNAYVIMQISICPVNEAHTVGVDTRLLLVEAPPSVKEKMGNIEEQKSNGADGVRRSQTSKYAGSLATANMTSANEMSVEELRVSNEDLRQQNQLLEITNRDLRELVDKFRPKYSQPDEDPMSVLQAELRQRDRQILELS